MSPAGCDYEMNAPCGQEGWELFPGSLHTYTPSQIPHYRPPSPCQCVMKLETEENSEGLQTDACSNEPFMGMMSLHERSGGQFILRSGNTAYDPDRTENTSRAKGMETTLTLQLVFVCLFEFSLKTHLSRNSSAPRGSCMAGIC